MQWRNQSRWLLQTIPLKIILPVALHHNIIIIKIFGSNYIGAISVYKVAAIANNLTHFNVSETVYQCASTMYDFHDCTDIFLNPSFGHIIVPKMYPELALKTGILVANVGYDLPEFKIRP